MRYLGRIIAPTPSTEAAIWARIREMLAKPKGVLTKFGGLDFRGVLLYNVDFPRADFRGVDLSKTVFCECHLGFFTTFSTSVLGAKFVNCAYYPNYHDDGLRLVTKAFPGPDGIPATIRLGEFEAPINTKGAFIAYKVVVNRNRPVLATLTVPADAKRLVYEGEGGRASKVRVDKLDGVDVGYSPFSMIVEEYRVGEVTKAAWYDKTAVLNSAGIHFRLTAEEAWEEYDFWNKIGKR